jgi:O-antigen/teichoic acid export membrane protein
MGIVIRQSLKSSVVAYIGVGLGIVNQLFISTKFLSPEQIGLSRILLENSIMFAAFAHIGTPFIADKFFSRFRDDDYQHHGFMVWLLAMPLIGCMLAVGLYFIFENQILSYFAERSPLLLHYHFLVIPITIFWVYVIVLEAYSRNNSRVVVPTFVREVYVRIVLMVLTLLFGFGWLSFDLFIYLSVAMYGSCVVVLLFYIKHLGKFYWSFDFFKTLKLPLFKEMMQYGLTIFLGGAGASVLLLIDRTMLAGQASLAAAGIFIIATYIATTIEIPRKSLTQITIPFLTAAIKDNDWAKVQSLHQKTALHQLLAGGLVFLLIWCNINEVFTLLPKGDVYNQGKMVVLLLSLAKLFDMAAGMSSEIIMYSRFFRYTTFFVLGMAVLCIAANRYLIPIYQINGAAFATALTTLIYSLTRMGFVWHKFRLIPYTIKALQVLAIFVCVFLAANWLPTFNGSIWLVLFSICYKSLIIIGLCCTLILKLNISDEVNGLWKMAIDKISF